MTRPGEKETHGSSRHHHHHHRKPPLCQNEDSPEKPHYRNIKPKVGHLYQSKLPKLGTALNSSRPAPVAYSTENPHLTVNEIESMDCEKQEESTPVSTVPRTTSSSTKVAAGYGPMQMMPVSSTTRRGGLLIHAPSKATNDFLHMIHPPPLSTNQEWIQAVLQTTSSGGRRKTKKRKYNLTFDLLTSATKKRNTTTTPIPREGDAHFLEFLTRRHDGNVDTAQLALLVASGAGRAYRTRRTMRNDNYVVTCLQSWQERLDRECPNSTTTSSSSSGKRQVFQNDDNDDMRRVWKAVLHVGQEFQNQVFSDQVKKKPLLSQVLGFVQGASCLPPPEDSYGPRHVLVEGISECMHALLDVVTSAHDGQAKLFDILYDLHDEGVDCNDVQTCLTELNDTLPVKLDSVVVVEKQLDLAKKWQARMNALTRNVLVADDNDDLAQAEELLRQAATLGIRWRGQVQLEERVKKAHALRNRLRQWQDQCALGKRENIKFVNALVRDANRLNVNFPEVSDLLRLHQTVEAWVERANTAVRSRIPLQEIGSLVDRAQEMPLDLSEFTNKLQSRIRQGQSWISEFQDLVPAPFQDGRVDNLKWMSRMRKALQTDDKHALKQLNDIATEGTRIPVEIDCVKLLLVEIDAKEWMQKAVKWIPNEGSDDEDGTNGGKRAKLIDIRDHLDKAEALRERIVLPCEERDAWVLEGEAELQSIIDAADDWYEKYKDYLVYDNRRNQGDRRCLSIATLRQIVNEGNLIHANIGTTSGKMARILGQAESWYEEFGGLLRRCGVTDSIATVSSLDATPSRPATPEEVKAAVESAEANVSLDLDEARALRELGERIQKWQDRVALAAPKRSKRVGKGSREESRYTVDDLLTLIDEAASLPITTDEDTSRLRQQLQAVHKWRLDARGELGNIANCLRSLRQAVIADYGLPDEFYDEESRENGSSENGEGGSVQEIESSVSVDKSQEKQVAGQVGETPGAMPVDGVDGTVQSVDDSSQAGTSQTGSDNMEGDSHALCRMISSLLSSAKLTGIRTAEEEISEVLEKIANWIIRSLECIDSPKKVYDKKSFDLFDEFVATGEELMAYRDSLQELTLDDTELLQSLVSSSGDLVSDLLVRLKVLKAHRDKFIAWFESAQKVLFSKEGRATMEVLNELAEQSHDYPASSDMVQKVRHVAQRAKKWKAALRALLDSGEKPTMHEAKELIDAGDKLNVMCDELKVLRNAVRTARAWANRVKRCKLDGGANSSQVTKLLNEHDSLLIEMPNEFSKLNSALSGHCLCRQPYDGFMVGCERCGEWYHGPCVGVTAARADKDKFLCVRCSFERIFKLSASSVASTIQKWSDPVELKKARQHEAQKHQRKVRKEKRDIENLALHTESLAAELNGLGSGAFEGNALESHVPNGVVEGVAVSPSESESNDAMVTSQPPESQSGNDHSHTSVTVLPPEAHGSDGVPMHDTGNDFPVPTMESSADETKDALLKRKQEIEAELHTAAAAVESSGERLAALTAIADVRKLKEDQEDEKKVQLRRWCLRVRSLVLVPSTMERAVLSLPLSDGSLSGPMQQVLNEAVILGIRDLEVVGEIENYFKCIAWCCFAMPLLAKRPSLQQVNAIVSKGTDLNLPEERPMRMVKSFAQRAKTWQNKAVKALAPKAYNPDPVNVDTLKGLVRAAADIPVSIPGENCVQNVIDDKGARYCVCGGPHIGSFMLSCDRCERWYHGRCVGIRSKEGDALQSWICPLCKGLPYNVVPDFTTDAFDYTDDEAEDEGMSDDEDLALNAPLPDKLWPPFGLLGSRSAIDALGATCCALKDDTESLVSQSFSMFAGSSAPAPASAFNPLFGTNGVGLQAPQLMNALNGYTFGGALSNEAAPVKPLFASNALAEHASSSLSSSASALTSAHSFQGLSSNPSQESSSDNNNNGDSTSPSGAHGFHGVGAVASNGFVGGFAQAARETSSSTNASSSENLESTTTASASSPVEDEQQEEEEDEKKPSPSTMNWKPPIMNAAVLAQEAVAAVNFSNVADESNNADASPAPMDTTIDLQPRDDPMEQDSPPPAPPVVEEQKDAPTELKVVL